MTSTDYFLIAMAGILTTVYKLINTTVEKIVPRTILKKTILSLLISVAIIPAVMDYFQLNVKVGIALSVVVNFFIEIILIKLETKVAEKIDNL